MTQEERNAIARTYPDQSHYSDLTVNGVPMKIPQTDDELIPYWMTDQGKAAAK